jgi:hypothetical protein
MSSLEYQRGYQAALGARDRVQAELDAAREENKRLRDLLKRTQGTWADSWDCSAAPGHPLMNDLMADIEAALAREDGGAD